MSSFVSYHLFSRVRQHLPPLQLLLLLTTLTQWPQVYPFILLRRVNSKRARSSVSWQTSGANEQRARNLKGCEWALVMHRSNKSDTNGVSVPMFDLRDLSWALEVPRCCLYCRGCEPYTRHRTGVRLEGEKDKKGA